MNAMKLTLVLTALVLGNAAHASITQASTQASATATAAIETAVLLDAQGRVVGTFNQAGQLMATAAASTAKQVRVTLDNGTAVTYDLAANVQAGSRTTLSTLIVKSGETRATLGSTLGTTLKSTVSTTQAASAQTHAGASLAAELLANKTVTLTDATGRTVGQFDANGNFTAQGDVSLAKNVTVTLASGQQRSFELASSFAASANKHISVETVNVRNEAQSVTLVSVLANIEKNATTNASAEGKASSTTQGNTNGTRNTSGSVNGSANSSASGSTGGGVSVGVGVGVGIGIGIGGK